MKRNLSNLDRAVRVMLGIAIIVLYFLQIISGTVAIILGAVALIFLATSFINFCPLYAVLRISTFRRKTSS